MADPSGMGMMQAAMGIRPPPMAASRGNMPQPPGMQDYANNMNGRAQMLRDQGMSEQQVTQKMKAFQASNPPPTYGSAMEQKMGIGNFMQGQVQGGPMMGVQGGPQFNPAALRAKANIPQPASNGWEGRAGVPAWAQSPDAMQAQHQQYVQQNPMTQRQQLMAQLMQQQPVVMNSNPGNFGAELLRQKQGMMQQPQFQAAVMPQGDMKRNALMDLAKQGAPKLGRSQPGMMYAGGSPNMGLARPGVMRRG